MMHKAFNIVVTIAFALVLVGPACIFAAEEANLQLPSWLTAEDAEYLSGGIEEENIDEVMCIDGFVSRELQTAVENEVGKRIPLKAIDMLTDAAWQRSCIAIANVPFEWTCYPTFYGSQRLFIPSNDALTYLPQLFSQDRINEIAAFGENLSGFAESNPNLRFVVYVVQGYQEPGVNPARALMSNPDNPAEQVEALEDSVDAERVFVLTGEHETLDDYYAEFMRTDHHWNYKGCETAYNQIADAIGLNKYESCSGHLIEGYLFSGATARWGRDLITEAALVSDDGFENLMVLRSDGEKVHYNHDAFYERNDPGLRYAFYDSYYSLGGSTIKGLGSSNCLVLCNSYGNGLAPYIASAYGKTVFADILHPLASDEALRLSEIINQESINDIIIVANPSDIASFVSRFPSFFSVG